MQSSKETFLSLVRLGIGHATCLPSSLNWQEVRTLAKGQGLYAIVLDGIEKLPEALKPPQEILLEWIGEVLQGYEYRYEQYCKSIAEMSEFYNSHGYKTMVLKGYACSLNWPKPQHRPCGDIDIWQFGKQKDADTAMAREKGIEVDNSHHHHTVFNFGEFTVENHYDFINVHHLKGNVKLEEIFKELGQDDAYSVEMKVDSNGSKTKVYLPSPNLHALFLLKHAMTDFAAFYVTLRQILDWALHVQKYHDEIDWKWFNGVVEQFHMKEFFNCINAICVEELGFNASIFPYVQFNPFLKDKVLDDVLSPRFARESPKCLIPRLFFKYRRWMKNSWKHDLCYNESQSSAFWTGIWNHLLKPSTI